MKVSVLVPYYPSRYEQFQRTKWLLGNQTYHDYEVLVIDDGGTDCDSPNLSHIKDNFYYKRLRERGTPPRSLNTAWNWGFNNCTGNFIILATPEVMPPKDAIERLVNHPHKDQRPVPTMFHIDYGLYKQLNGISWKPSLNVLLSLIGFMNIKTPWGYTNHEAVRYCNNTNYSGQTKDWWKKVLGKNFFPETEEYMKDEPYLHERELELGIPSYCINFSVYHQWHERRDKQYSVRIKRIRDSV